MAALDWASRRKGVCFRKGDVQMRGKTEKMVVIGKVKKILEKIITKYYQKVNDYIGEVGNRTLDLSHAKRSLYP
jgi:hypothetical protein